MVVGDLFSLINLAKSFADSKKTLNRAFFDDFIYPAWLTFSKIHEQYEQSLQEYMKLVSEGLDAKQLEERIAQDVLFSGSLRLELSQLLKNNFQADKSLKGQKEQSLAEFASALIAYFNSRRAFQAVWGADVENDETTEGEINLGYTLAKHELSNPRTAILGSLQMIQLHASTMSSNQIEGFQKSAHNSFAKMVQYLQEQYKAVADAYYALRVEFLKP